MNDLARFRQILKEELNTDDEDRLDRVMCDLLDSMKASREKVERSNELTALLRREIGGNE